MTQASVSDVSTVSDVSQETEKRPKKLSSEQAKVLAFFAANPHRVEEKSRLLSLEIGVSHPTIWRVQKMIKADSSLLDEVTQ